MAYSRVNVDTDVPLQIGDEFSTYEALESTIAKLEESQCVTYYKRDSRTIEGAKGRVKHDINVALKYYEVKFSCIKGGKNTAEKVVVKDQTKGSHFLCFHTFTCIHNTCRTLRENCPSFVKARANVDGKNPVIANMNLNHNHTSSV